MANVSSLGAILSIFYVMHEHLVLNWYGPILKLHNIFFYVDLKYPIPFNFVCSFGGEACRQMYCIEVVIAFVLHNCVYISTVKKFPVALWSKYS